MELSGHYVFDMEGNNLDKGAGQLPEDINTMYCVVLKDCVSGEKISFDMFDGWEELKRIIWEAKTLIGHNIIDFDLPVFKRLHGIVPNPSCIIIDTLVWSRALYPDRKYEGGHGLEAWGHRNGLPKPGIESWDEYTPDVLHRCEMDVENNYMTYQKLMQEASMYNSGIFLWTEQQVAQIISNQSKRGHAFDLKLAEALISNLGEWLNQIDVNLGRFMKAKPRCHNKPVKQVKKKDGDYAKDVYAWFSEEFEEARQYGPVQPGKEKFSIEAGLCDEENPEAFCRVIYPDINFGSDKQILEQLTDLGYQAVEFTDKGNPQITEESFNIEENRHLKVMGQQICKRRQLAHRFSMVKGWVENLSADGRIRGYVNPQGAVTLRMTHSIVVNVPKWDPEERWSEYYRACFRSSDIPEDHPEHDVIWEYDRPTFKEDEDGNPITEKAQVQGRMAMVGCDASGLENRMIAHYLNDEELTKKILQDFHTLIWKSVEYYLKSRGSTKNWEYAYFFGAQDLKLGTMLDHVDEVTEEEAWEAGWRELKQGKNKGKWKAETGKPIPWRLVKYAVNGARSRAMIEKEIPEMGALVKDVQDEAQQGFLTLFDGRRLIMRRGYDGSVMQHKALNTRIQGSGALIMKAAQVILSRWLISEGIEAYFINSIHDEFQMECYPKDRFRVAQLMEESIRWAGRHFNLNVELDAESKIGINWAETH